VKLAGWADRVRAEAGVREAITRPLQKEQGQASPTPSLLSHRGSPGHPPSIRLLRVRIVANRSELLVPSSVDSVAAIGTDANRLVM
jgi:hypothetical protein